MQKTPLVNQNIARTLAKKWLLSFSIAAVVLVAGAAAAAAGFALVTANSSDVGSVSLNFFFIETGSGAANGFMSPEGPLWSSAVFLIAVIIFAALVTVFMAGITAGATTRTFLAAGMRRFSILAMHAAGRYGRLRLLVASLWLFLCSSWPCKQIFLARWHPAAQQRSRSSKRLLTQRILRPVFGGLCHG
jgi:hypothetical protein